MKVFGPDLRDQKTRRRRRRKQRNWRRRRRADNNDCKERETGVEDGEQQRCLVREE